MAHEPAEIALARPQRHLQRVQGKVGCQRRICQPTMNRLEASITKATWT